MSVHEIAGPAPRATARVRVGVIAIASVAATLLTTAAQTPRTRDFKPVTDQMLLNPDSGDWIHWRRTLDGWGYSPLNQINRQNVGNLKLAWSWSMPPTANQLTPLVYNGVMYLPYPGGIQALDAATGEFIWEHKRPSGLARRNIAIYGDKILAGTLDAHLIALSAQTGALVWDRTVADAKLGYKYTSGPIVVKGKVVAGMTGCEKYKEDICFVSAYEAETGNELWRTSTVARPGEPGGDTWGELPLRFRAGGDAWMPGSYDAETNLIYWGTAQAKPWARFQRGTDGAALYTNSTLALNPETGKIVWHYQHIPGESHDLDEVFESILVNHGDRRSLFKMGKIGVLWELDRKTGKFLNAYDMGYQNVVTIDPETGQGLLRPEVIQKLDVPVEYCPGPGGFKNVWALAYHPETQALYIPLKLSCARSVFGEVPRVVGGGGYGRSERKSLPHPKDPEHMAEFVALDVRTGKVLWRKPNSLPYDTGVLTTGGGLVFVGDFDSNFYAHDAATGAILWQTRTPSAADGFPVTYTVRGRQYLAVPSGAGQAVTWRWHIRDLLPQFQRVTGIATMQVFALPEGRTQ